MKIENSYTNSINLLSAATKNDSIQKMSVKENEIKDVSVDISDEGLAALKTHTKELNPKIEEPEFSMMTAFDTNEVESEHYFKMMDISGDVYEKIRKEENRDVNINDIMKTMMDSYETVYNDIVKAHENGDREVDYDITGKQTVTLEQDLDGLNKAFNRRLANLEGYITAQQTNKQFEASGREALEYHKRRLGIQSENQNKTKEKNDFNYFERDYQDTVKNIMHSARESFLNQLSPGKYQKGMGVSILTDLMVTNNSFVEGTKKLFS